MPTAARDPSAAKRKDKPENKAVAYAEEKLGVHDVWQQAEDAYGSLNTMMNEYTSHTASLRDLRESLSDAEMQIAIDERSTDEGRKMSQAAFDRHLKGVLQQSEATKELRKNIMHVQHKADEAEQAISLLQYRLRLHAARMNELAGLLAFYAATKTAKPTKKEGDHGKDENEA